MAAPNADVIIDVGDPHLALEIFARLQLFVNPAKMRWRAKARPCAAINTGAIRFVEKPCNIDHRGAPLPRSSPRQAPQPMPGFPLLPFGAEAGRGHEEPDMIGTD